MVIGSGLHFGFDEGYLLDISLLSIRGGTIPIVVLLFSRSHLHTLSIDKHQYQRYMH
jgi:hypothetical protein